MIKCQVIMEAMEKIAPCKLAEDWDNPGLLLGNPGQNIEKIITCLDVSEEVVQTAIVNGCNMIVSHHPFIFHALKRIRTDLPQGRIIQQILKHNIAVFAAHTNLDIAHGGVNDVLCDILQLQDVKPLTNSFVEKLLKLVVFVPESHSEAVRSAIGKAGAGFTGNYSNCSFTAKGKGFFLPLAGTHPYIGEVGKLAAVDEVRIETIFPARIKNKVVKAMLTAHPYEEAAYEISPLMITGDVTGLGRIGRLKEAISLEEFARQIKNKLPEDAIRMVKGNNSQVKKIALCTGAGAELINAAKRQGADVYITGDIKYHEAQRAQELGLNLIDAGHFGTEYPIAEALAEKLTVYAEKDKWNIQIISDRKAKSPFTTV